MSSEKTEHIHDEHCACGCHEEHAHSHDHEHEHEHTHGPIEVTTHDASIIGSYRFSAIQTYEEANDTFRTLLKEIANRITEQGGIVGHIKAVVSAERSCMISVTDEEADMHEIEVTECTVEGVAIVFGISPDQLGVILETVFETYL